jgi:aryl-alcohol dehydrogenase
MIRKRKVEKMKVRAAVHLGIYSGMVVKRVDLEAPRPDEVLIKTVACGVCHTDLWVRKHYVNPMILGHEASGVVVRVGGDVRNLAAGDHVVTAYNWCGECEACKKGRTWECQYFSDNFSGFRPDGSTPFSLNGKPVAPLMREGGFSSYMVCHKNSVVKVDADLDLRILAPMGCGIMTGAGSVLNYLKPKAGSSIAVFGTGCVGLSAIMAARIAHCHPIIAVDRVASRLELAAEFGATHCIDSGKADVGETIKNSCGGVDYAFDTSGDYRLLDAMRKTLNPNASACGVGIGGVLVLSADERKEGKTWATTDAGFSVPHRFIPQLIAYYRDGQLPFEKMLHFYRFAEIEIEKAFVANHRCTSIKPVVVFK